MQRQVWIIDGVAAAAAAAVGAGVDRVHARHLDVGVDRRVEIGVVNTSSNPRESTRDRTTSSVWTKN